MDSETDLFEHKTLPPSPHADTLVNYIKKWVPDYAPTISTKMVLIDIGFTNYLKKG